jgi:hypothetical protein
VAVEDYPWLAEWQGALPPMVRLEDRFPSPPGWTRVEAEKGSYAAWLGGLPVHLERTTVLSHRGLPLPASAAAVVVLDLGDGDLQQCADTILRLHAEYRWSRGEAGRCAYHFTSGDLSSWEAWVAGERFQVVGPRVERRSGEPRDSDHATFRRWLQHLFVYAGTLSLDLDSRPIAPSEALGAGDFFVDGGSPGHALMVLDVARDRAGRPHGLIGQGYTPAQEMHVLESADEEVVDGVWFPLPDEGQALTTPAWRPFPRASARRFVDR